MDHRELPELSRRGFLIATASAAAGAFILASCGDSHQRISGAEEPHAESFDGSITGAASANVPAVRLNPPEAYVPVLNWHPGQFVTSVETDQPHYAGTLDDGPSPHNTDQILLAADKHNVKLTFFMIGDMLRAFPEIGRRVRDAGHQIGGHSVHHTPYTASGLAPQIAENQQIINDILGVTPTVVRAPGLTRGQVYLNACAAAGVYELQTSWATNDWSSSRIPAIEILREHINGLNRGGVEINHDGGGKRPTSDAYDAMLAHSATVGINSVTADELMAMGTPMPASGGYPRSNSYPAIDEQDYIQTCNFDVQAELVAILAAGSLKRASRSRVVEVIADIEMLQKAG